MDFVWWVSLVLVVATALYAGWVLRGRLRLWFILMLVLTASYELMLLPEAGFDAWWRHFPFYIGELCFLFLLLTLEGLSPHLKIHTTGASRPTKKPPAHSLLPAIAVTPINGITFLTEQGLDHILVLPIFIVAVVISIVRESMSSHSYRYFMLLWTAAMSCFVMEHFTEFLLESLGLGGGLRPHVEFIEKLWLWFGLAVLMYSLRAFQRRTRDVA